MPRVRRPSSLLALETASWNYRSLADPLTIAPILALLKATLHPSTTIIHKSILSAAELERYLDLWTRRGRNGCAVLMLSCHGLRGRLQLDVQEQGDDTVDLDWIEERLENRCAGRLIHFGACSVLGVKRKRIRQFLENTGALAITGFDRQVDWLEASALEMLVIRRMFSCALDGRGIRGLRRYVKEDVGAASRRLGFQLFVD